MPRLGPSYYSLSYPGSGELERTAARRPRKFFLHASCGSRRSIANRLRWTSRFAEGGNLPKVSLLCTDQWPGYRNLDREYPHGVIDHARGQYVISAIHTQTIEGFWSIIKRGIVGTFHKVSRKYMPLYAAEFQFRYNKRGNADNFGTAINGC
jgi:ISXO2-like transposase domain